jgi:hypothetical protein
MSLSHFWRKFNPAHPAPADAGKAPSSDTSNELHRERRSAAEPVPTTPRLWGRKTSSTDIRTTSSPTPAPPRKSTAETSSTTEVPPASPSVLQNNPSTESHQEMTLARGLMPYKLDESWDLVKSGPSDSGLNRRLDAFGEL